MSEKTVRNIITEVQEKELRAIAKQNLIYSAVSTECIKNAVLEIDVLRRQLRAFAATAVVLGEKICLDKRTVGVMVKEATHIMGKK